MTNNSIKWKDLKPGTLLQFKNEDFSLRASSKENDFPSIRIKKGQVVLFLKLVEIKSTGSGLYSFIFGDKIVYSVFPQMNVVSYLYDILG